MARFGAGLGISRSRMSDPLSHMVSIGMGATVFWWRLSTPTKIGDTSRTAVLFFAALQCYVHALALVK
jgi:hypothetical protein